MTVGKYLETLPETQIVTIYNSNNNIEYHGKAGYAPVYFDFVELTNTAEADEHPGDILINVQETKPQSKIYTANKETGEHICECQSIEEAKALIDLYEAEDWANGCYENDWYDIVDEYHNSLI